MASASVWDRFSLTGDDFHYVLGHVFWWMCICINVNVFKVSKVGHFLNIVVTGFSLSVATRLFKASEAASALTWNSQRGWVGHIYKALEVLVREARQVTKHLTDYLWGWRKVFGSVSTDSTARSHEHTTTYTSQYEWCMYMYRGMAGKRIHLSTLNELQHQDEGPDDTKLCIKWKSNILITCFLQVQVMIILQCKNRQEIA